MQPIQLTGLRFLFNGGTFLNVLMPVEEAKTLVRRWASGDLALRGEKRITGGDREWAVSLDSIAAIHLVADAPQSTPNAFPGAIPAVSTDRWSASGFGPIFSPYGGK